MHKVGFIWSGHVGMFRFVYLCKIVMPNEFKDFFFYVGLDSVTHFKEQHKGP
jgi:hypothetical protein